MPKTETIEVSLKDLDVFQDLANVVSRLYTAAEALLDREDAISLEAWREVNDLRAALNALRRWSEGTVENERY
jgi:hypothetical protein